MNRSSEREGPMTRRMDAPTTRRMDAPTERRGQAVRTPGRFRLWIGLPVKISLFLAAILIPLAIMTWTLSAQALRARMTEEFTSKGSAIARILASSGADLILTRDASTVQALVDQYAAIGGTTANGAVDTLEEDSQLKGVTNFQRPEDGAWDPRNPQDFYFVTTSSFGPLPAESRTGETRLWRLRFADPTDPSQGGTLTLLVSGPVGTPDSPSATGTQSAGSTGPQMFDNLTVNDRGQVLLQEDIGNQTPLGKVWQYFPDTDTLQEIAHHDPDRFAPGAPNFLTQDEESSGIIPAPFLGESWYLLDVQAHYSIAGELVEGGQLLALHVPPGKK